jgi:RNA polymerase sigma factor (sigma-70 family)
MANGQNGAAFRHVRTLFSVGAIGGLTDGQLLERFKERDGEGAELAFTALVERHGPMVLRVCRSILVDPNDAHDAFQATFLVLVRRAGSLWVRDSLGPWLHQVAQRTAACARSAAARRRRHEAAASGRSSRPAGDGVEQHDLGEILHGEVGRLPDRYRVIIVLCLLEGLTHGQAARRLGWPIGTVQSRLARGKALLRDRLTRRGLAPSALVLGGIVSSDGVAAEIPAALVGSTVHTATRSTLGGTAISPSIVGLANQVLTAMRIFRLNLILSTIILAAFVLGAGVYRTRQASGQAERALEGRGEPAGPKQGQSQTPDSDRSTLVAPSDVNARAGRGTMLVFALDENGRRIDLGGASKGTFKEVSQEHRWAVITGVLDHRAIRERLSGRLGEDSINVHPDYRRAEVERQAPGPGGDWSAWSRVDREENCLILRNLPEEEAERTPEELRLAALVDPLPFLKAGVWEGVDVERLIAGPKGTPPVRRSAGRGIRLPFPTTEAPEIMVRSLDFTVEPGSSYRYRVRIVIDGTDGVGQRREVMGPWSEPTAPVRIPE